MRRGMRKQGCSTVRRDGADTFMRPINLTLATLTALTLGVGQSSLEASSVIPLDLQQCVHYSGLAFAGTVSRVRAEYTRDHSTIVTRVTFSHIVVAKGRHNWLTLTMTLEGGRVGPEEIIVPGQPQFELGRRYILLVDSDLGTSDNSYIPVIGMYQGFFTVDKDSSRREDVVMDLNGRPVVAIRDGHVVVLGRKKEDIGLSSVRRGPVRTSSRDIYVPGSGEASQGRGDTLQAEHLPQRVPEETARKRVGPPDSSPRTTHPAKTYPVPTPSPTPQEIVAADDDSGTRVGEAEFLEAIREMSTR